MAEKDNQVLELLEKAKAELGGIESKLGRNTETNCKYKIGVTELNLNVLNIDQLVDVYADLLMIKHFKQQALQTLEVKKGLNHLGYPIADWESDIKLKLKILKNKYRRELLISTINSLEDLMSKELKDEIALQEIIKILND